MDRAPHEDPSDPPPPAASGAGPSAVEFAETAGEDLTGRRLGDYHLLRRLGQGAMAEVYLAEQQSLRRQVALKLLRSPLAADPTFLRRFQLEAQAAASLVDAHIVQIYEVGCIDGRHYIAQEYVAGQNLAQRLRRDGPLDAAGALKVLRQTAAALAKAGERGIVHRDIKPENILLSPSGEVKVADFGLARLPGSAASMALTQVGVTLGTPLYMSPEQAEGKPLDSRSDLYSLGVTCYQMLAGQPPFTGDSPLAVAVQHLQAEPKPLASFRPDLPSGLCRIVHRLLAKRPADRYGTPRDLLRDLRLLAGVTPHEATGESPAWDGADDDESTDEVARTQALTALSQALQLPPPQQGRGRTVARWGLAVAAAALAGAALGWVLRPGDPLASAQGAALAVPRGDTVYAQWMTALSLRTEEAWLSIERYFPGEEYFVRRAEQQLARLYLKQDRLDEAWQLFDQFASQDADLEQKAFGLAGRAIIQTLRSEYQASQETLHQLAQYREYLRGTDLTQALLRSAAANRRALSRAEADEFEQWIESRFAEPAD